MNSKEKKLAILDGGKKSSRQSWPIEHIFMALGILMINLIFFFFAAYGALRWFRK